MSHGNPGTNLGREWAREWWIRLFWEETWQITYFCFEFDCNGGIVFSASLINAVIKGFQVNFRFFSWWWWLFALWWYLHFVLGLFFDNDLLFLGWNRRWRCNDTNWFILIRAISFAWHVAIVRMEYVQGSLRLLRFGGRPTGFGLEIAFDVPAVKKSARNALAGERTDKCPQSRNGFAATWQNWRFIKNIQFALQFVEYSAQTYLWQAIHQCLRALESCLFGNVRNNVIKCFTWCCAVPFAPHQLIQKLLNDLARQQWQCVLEHARHNRTQIVHDIWISVFAVGCCRLIDEFVAHREQGALVHGQIGGNGARFVHPQRKRLENFGKSFFVILFTVGQRFNCTQSNDLRYRIEYTKYLDFNLLLLATLAGCAQWNDTNFNPFARSTQQRHVLMQCNRANGS